MKTLRVVFFSLFKIIIVILMTSCSMSENKTFVQLTNTPLSDKSVSVGSLEEEPIRFGVVSIMSIRETHRLYYNFKKYLEEQLGRPIEIIQTQTYSEMKELFERNEIDAGIVCSYLAVIGSRDEILKKIAMPVINGEKKFTSYIITQKNSEINSLEDLYNKSFAFSDPLSYSGYLVTKYDIMKGKNDFNKYFSNTYFTYSHDNTIIAVSNGLVDAGATHSSIFEKLKSGNNPIVDNIIIIGEGEYVGQSPIVVNPNIDDEFIKQLTDVVLNMHLNEKGKVALNKLSFDYFDLPEKELYEPITQILEEIENLK
ncbi:hypothetical protein BKP45_11950 [Anaerobacillus alkalidiazotrophicus]|uniref:Phosphonate ABC transporter substrate-binding protein n=1 Tax=Anaerobacillus alkalidiazotrophicus TaxID=472963 RepID=A0A1S2M4U6_9BACI|nr:phosphate/phosphite/phosphonate ABC transporter substrate-binding protein [Anaerobacillus alkalidiazotrophicus]OIJ18289.1 hypothetical protein BKP45_17665 [Anaerobacillus alkalidiazotrophicus]OIJ19768.1 hypothetical protein BKP45_11950 [Anaerobacillus alkalidiazotrophicus]